VIVVFLAEFLRGFGSDGGSGKMPVKDLARASSSVPQAMLCGATLMLFFATRVPQAGGAPRDRSISSTKNNKRARILVADDDPSIRELLKDELSEAGYEVEVAVDGVDALERLRRHPHDAAILDLLMPKMSGWRVWDELKLDPALRDVAVVIYTGTGLSSGAVGPAPVVAKSSPLDTLLLALEAALLRND